MLGIHPDGGEVQSHSMIPFEEALEIVRSHARTISPLKAETVPLFEAQGRVLARGLPVDRDQPAFNRSTRDGYALRALEAGTTLTIVGSARAGDSYAGRIPPHCCVEIMTGAPVPRDADCVVMLEHVDRSGDTIRLLNAHAVHDGLNIVKRGSEARIGELLLNPGTQIDPAAIAVAATCGFGEVSVFERPSIAILATGDELVKVSATPSAYQIRNSNTYSLGALVRSEGALPLLLEPAADNIRDLRLRIEAARSADLLVLSGGVSAGRYDLVEPVLAELGAEFFFTSVAIQPGKPVVFGRLPATAQQPAQYFFGLPGNPVSTFVTFLLFVRPLVAALAGATVTRPAYALATLIHEIAGKPGLTRFLPAILNATHHKSEVALRTWQGSGDTAANLRANCYAVLPAEKESFHAGEVISILLR